MTFLKLQVKVSEFKTLMAAPGPNVFTQQPVATTFRHKNALQRYQKGQRALQFDSWTARPNFSPPLVSVLSPRKQKAADNRS